jgi:two-component system, NarL family, nitrate/nitrite response regulator NarL
VHSNSLETEQRPIRVMLVDDHRSVLLGLEKLIEAERSNMQVVAKATSRASAIALVADERPDVVVLDLDLGGEDGAELIPLLIEAAATRVLVLTGMRDATAHEASVLRGASGVVRKEEPGETLLKAIERVHQGELWLDRGMTARVFVELGRGKGLPRREPEKRELMMLTPREREIVQQLAAHPGADNRKLAMKIGMGEHTLRNHLSRIYDKLGVSNRLELYLLAQRHGMDRID